MADRTVKVTLSAQVQGYIDGMTRAATATKEVGSESEKLTQYREAFNQVGVAALGMGVAAAAGVTLAVAKWADFDQAMSNVKAATGESAENMQALSDAALDAGARTVFSAEESANAIEELAKAGVSTADILNGALDGALDLAAAGGLEVADAAGIAATALKTFNLEGSDMSHVADLLAAGAGKAMGDVTDLSGALNQSAMVANATGLSIEETTATLAAFASQGLLGSDAGTSFKSMLQSLTPSSAAAKQTMEELGISAYDAQGNFIGMTEFAGNLQDGLKDLSVEQQQAALKTIFGSDAIRAATVLYSEGAEGIGEWIDAVDDQGYAAEQAAARLDNLKGDLEALGGALDTALIKTGSGANDVLRGMVQWITDAVDAYNELPAPLQGITLGVGLLTAGVALLGGAMLVGVNQIAAFKTALITLNVSAAGARAALLNVARFLIGPWGAAFAVAAASAALLTKVVEEGRTPIADIGNALRTTADSAKALQLASETSGFEAFWMGDAAEQLKELPRLMDDAKEHGTEFWDHVFSGRTNSDIAALGTLNRFSEGLAEVASIDLSKAQSQFRDLAASQKLTDEQTLTLLESMPQYREALLQVASDQGIAADSSEFLALALGETTPEQEKSAKATQENADALAELEGKAAASTEEIEKLMDIVRGLGSATFDTREANRALEESVADLSEELVANGLNLDTTTVQGRAVESAVDDMAQSILESAAAAGIQANDQEVANQKLAEGRERLIAMLEPYMGSRDAAAAYVDQLGLIEPTKVTSVVVETANAHAKIDALKASFPTQFTVKAMLEGPDAPFKGTPHLYPSGAGADGFIQAYADGGMVNSGIYSGGAPIYKFAEHETGWEALISGKAGQESRNRQIWVEAGHRLDAFSGVKEMLAGTGGGVRPGDSLALRVGDREFTAFVEGVSGGVTQAASVVGGRTVSAGSDRRHK